MLNGERRVVTILFADVKGSTAMADRMDPEEVLEVMNGAFRVLIEPIAHHGGQIARLMGGTRSWRSLEAPVAHEDDPDRACRAALEKSWMVHGNMHSSWNGIGIFEASTYGWG